MKAVGSAYLSRYNERTRLVERPRNCSLLGSELELTAVFNYCMLGQFEKNGRLGLENSVDCNGT